MMRYSILCYGDSNTYGYVPAGNGKRYDEDVRWPALLREKLGEGYAVIEEGCSGRTTDVDPPGEAWKNGMAGLLISLHSHKPVDLIILMLGTNDLKSIFRRDAGAIAESAANVAGEAVRYLAEKQGYAPVILFLCPPRLGEDVEHGVFGGAFDHRSYEVSRQLGPAYKKQAEENGFVFLDTSAFLSPSPADHLHLDEKGHTMLAERLLPVIRKIREAGDRQK